MRNPVRHVVCPQCDERLEVPDAVGQAKCVRCGAAFALTGPPSQSIQTFVERPANDSGNAALELPAHYASWEEFRALSPTIQSELLKLAMHPLPDMRLAEWRALPVNLPAKVDEFGRPLAWLAVPGESRSLNWTVGVFVALVGCLVLVVSSFELGAKRLAPLQRDAVSAYSLLMLVGLVGAAFGVWYAFYRHPSLAVNLWIFAGGLFLQRGSEVEACGWENIKDLKADREIGRPIHHLTTRENFRVLLSADQTPAVMPLAEFIKINITSAQLLPKLRRIFDGERVKFGVILLDCAGLTGPQFFASWSAIVRVMIDDASVFIECRDRPDWHQIRYRDVSFAPLLLAIAHILIEEEKRLAPIEA